MRNLCLALLVLACACSSTDDMTTASGSGSTTAASASDGSSGVEGSESGGAPTTEAPTECSGDYLCSGEDAAACEADKCCVAVHGRRYEQSDDAWCLGPDDVYVGCAHKYNSAPCDHTGTIKCTDSDNEDYFAELDEECFPHGCLTGTAPETNGAVCGQRPSWSEQHGPCAAGVCPLDGASVCGPPCGEKGPGFVRCPASEVQAQTICPWPGDGPQAPCLITCSDHDDCPDPGMVCLPCPDVFAADCPLGDTFGDGPHMCAWPDVS